MPEFLKNVKRYKGNTPIFHHYKIENKIQHVLQREVPLPGGGSIVIEPTEAMTTIDVNSGKSHHGKNTEETALHTDLEAAQEIARQMRMRDLGGIIAVDFIDMQSGANRKRICSKMVEMLKEDMPLKAKEETEGIIKSLRKNNITDKEIIEIQEKIEELSNLNIDSFTRNELLNIESLLENLN